MGQRLDFIDAARGLAILLVVLGHGIQYTDPAFDANLAFRMIYAVHMPLFMFLSGYVTSQPQGMVSCRDQRFWHKLRDLLVPYVVWLPMGYLAAVWLQQPPGFSGSFAAFIGQVPRSPDLGLWFLLVLAECHLLLLLASMFGARPASWIALCLLLLINVLVLWAPDNNWLGLGLLRWHFFFFMAGHLLRRHQGFPPALRPAVMALIAFGLLATFWYRKSAVPVDWLLGEPPGTVRQLATQGYHAVTALAGIAAILGLVAAAGRATWFAWPQRWLVYLGTRSLHIYAGHYPFLYLAIGLTAGMATLTTSRVLVVGGFALTAALLLALVIAQWPGICRLVYGRLSLTINH